MSDQPSETTEPEPIISEETYVAFKMKAQDGIFQAAQMHDKAILTLSSGAFALSMVFLKDIAPAPTDGSLTMLFFAWLSLFLSIAAVLFSFHFSSSAFHQLDGQVDYIHRHRKEAPKGEDKGNFFVNNANVASMFFLLVGILLLAIFSFQNLKQEGSAVPDKKEGAPANKGQVNVNLNVSQKASDIAAARSINPPTSYRAAEGERGAAPIAPPVASQPLDSDSSAPTKPEQAGGGATSINVPAQQEGGDKSPPPPPPPQKDD